MPKDSWASALLVFGVVEGGFEAFSGVSWILDAMGRETGRGYVLDIVVVDFGNVA